MLSSIHFQTTTISERLSDTFSKDTSSIGNTFCVVIAGVFFLFRRADQLVMEDNIEAVPYCVAAGQIEKV